MVLPNRFTTRRSLDLSSRLGSRPAISDVRNIQRGTVQNAAETIKPAAVPRPSLGSAGDASTKRSDQAPHMC